MFISAILQNAQSLIDLFWVGRLGSESVAALAVSGSILFLLWPLVMGMSVGTVALVSRHTGAGRTDLAAVAAGQSLVLSVAAGLAVGAAGLAGLGGLLRLMGPAPAVAGLAQNYLTVSFAGYATVFLLALSGSALQGAGQARLPMTAMILANLTNLALDPVLIFGWFGCPALGVRGAAVATVLSQATGCALLISALGRGVPGLRLDLGDLRLRAGMVWDLFRIGIFSAGQMLARSLMGFALFRIVAGCGTAALAGYGIGMRFHQVILLPSFALGNAAAALVGQNLGAGRPDRAARGAWLAAGVGASINLAAAAAMLVLAPP
jgi:putative MATE family efflux protein